MRLKIFTLTFVLALVLFYFVMRVPLPSPLQQRPAAATEVVSHELYEAAADAVVQPAPAAPAPEMATELAQETSPEPREPERELAEAPAPEPETLEKPPQPVELTEPTAPPPEPSPEPPEQIITAEPVAEPVEIAAAPPPEAPTRHEIDPQHHDAPRATKQNQIEGDRSAASELPFPPRVDPQQSAAPEKRSGLSKPQITEADLLSEAAESLATLFRATSPPPPAVVEEAPQSVSADDPIVDELEGLFADTGSHDSEAGARHDTREFTTTEPQRGSAAEPPTDSFVTGLEALFPEREAAAPVAQSSVRTDPLERRRLTEATPRSLPEWRAQERALRTLARREDGDRASAVFRLEPQDPVRFRRIATQYGMDVLLATPSKGVYAIVPHDKGVLDQRRYADEGAHLREHYGLSVRGLGFPWLESLRDRHVATQLIPAASVDVALLVPKAKAEVILGKIILGCRKFGHSVETVRACYGTFVERTLSGQNVFDYEVTRLILPDGKEVRAPPAASSAASPDVETTQLSAVPVDAPVL